MRTTMRNVMSLAAPLLIASLGLVACSGDKAGPSLAAETPATTTRAPRPSPTPTAPQPDRDGDGIPDGRDTYPDDPTNTPPPRVTLRCSTDTTTRSFEIEVVPPATAPDFSGVWAAQPTSACSATRNTPPLIAIESAANSAAGFTTTAQVEELYATCAEVPLDLFIIGPVVAKRLAGAAVLCPNHPQAGDMALVASGRLFDDGTYLVNSEIKPGTYAISGNITGCYWERQDRNGGIIDNYFSMSTRRVQVTIRSSDYAFHSEDCGTWRPA